MKDNEIEIKHESQNKRYVITIDDHEAELTYRLKENVINFNHTRVPSALEGRGIGSKLVRHGLDEAQEKGYKVKPTCPFVKSYIDRHPEYQPLLA